MEHIDPATALLLSALFWLFFARISATERRERRAALREYEAYRAELLEQDQK